MSKLVEQALAFVDGHADVWALFRDGTVFGEVVTGLAEPLRSWNVTKIAGVEARGYQIMEARTPATGAGIVSFRKAGLQAPDIVRKLRAAGVAAAPRAGWVRTSPHFYISPEDIDRMLELLP